MKPSYKTNAQLDCKYGAPMGRVSIQDACSEDTIKLYMSRINMNGDYDCNGTYFGYGELYWVADSAGDVDYVVRAKGRDAAKAMVREEYPKAVFFR